MGWSCHSCRVSAKSALSNSTAFSSSEATSRLMSRARFPSPMAVSLPIRDQLHNDGAQLAADVARDKEKVREAFDDVRHPERLAEATEEKLAQVAEDVREVAVAGHVGRQLRAVVVQLVVPFLPRLG